MVWAAKSSAASTSSDTCSPRVMVWPKPTLLLSARTVTPSATTAMTLANRPVSRTRGESTLWLTIFLSEPLPKSAVGEHRHGAAPLLGGGSDAGISPAGDDCRQSRGAPARHDRIKLDGPEICRGKSRIDASREISTVPHQDPQPVIDNRC